MSATAQLRAFLGLVGLLTAAGMAALAWLLIAFPHAPATGSGKPVTLPPPAELGVDGLGERLRREGVIANTDAFRALVRLLDASAQLRESHTVIRANQDLHTLWPLLFTGRGDPLLRMTFPEGLTRFDFAARLSKFGVTDADRFLRAGTRADLLTRWGVPGPSVEGYLFPDTYEMRVPTGAAAVATRLVETSMGRLATTLKAHAAEAATLRDELAMGPHEIVILASIVEKEARLPRERPQIAGVFLNRLRDPSFRPHRLQADPTVSYGCLVAPEKAASCQEFDGRRVTPAMVRDPDNPYNTYRHDGLPPGPICSPGLDAIRAVLQAPRHDLFYFVAQGDGSHAFSRTLEEHNQAIERARHGG